MHTIRASPSATGLRSSRAAAGHLVRLGSAARGDVSGSPSAPRTPRRRPRRRPRRPARQLHHRRPRGDAVRRRGRGGSTFYAGPADQHLRQPLPHRRLRRRLAGRRRRAPADRRTGGPGREGRSSDPITLQARRPRRGDAAGHRGAATTPPRSAGRRRPRGSGSTRPNETHVGVRARRRRPRCRDTSRAPAEADALPARGMRQLAGSLGYARSHDLPPQPADVHRHRVVRRLRARPARGTSAAPSTPSTPPTTTCSPTTYGARDLAISSVGVARPGRRKAVTAAMVIRIACDVSDGLILAGQDPRRRRPGRRCSA